MSPSPVSPPAARPVSAAELRSPGESLRRAASFAGLGVVRCNAEGAVVWADGAAASLLGLTEAAGGGAPSGAPVLPTPPFQLELDCAAREAPWKVALEHGEVRGAVARVRTAQGRIRSLLFDGVRLDSDAAASLGAAIELLVQPKPEALEDNPACYRVIFEGVNDGIVVHDVETGAIVDMNHRVAEMRGLPEDAAANGRPEQCSWLPAAESNREAIKRMKLAAAGEPQVFESPTLGADGSPMWLEVSLKRARIDHCDRLLAVVRDVTERKNAEKRLQQSEERFRAIVNSTHDIVWTLDTRGNLTFVNARGEELTGYRFEQWAGKNFGPLVHPDDMEKSMRALERALNGESVNYRVRLMAADGQTLQLMANVEPMYEEGVIAGVLGLGRDTTEQFRLEDELHKAQRLESLGLLAGGIAHDFNNILTAIVGSVTLAKQMRDRPEVVIEALDMAESACIRARDLTQQLLTFSRGGAPVKKPGSVAELLRETASFSLRGTNVRAELDLEPGLWWVEMDGGQMSQVIHNLLINAAQAMPTGGTVRLRAHNCDIELEDTKERPLNVGRYVCVVVTDHGQGIAPEHLARIFDPYFSTKPAGSGLGLATSFSIVRRHGGHIEASSRLGRGASFVLYLPATDVAPVKSDEATARLRAGSGRVLLMDDEEMIRQVGGKMLELLGYHVVRAREGAEAIHLYEQARSLGAPFDAVILDLTVPGGMGGKDTAARLRALHPEARLIASSGYSTDPVMADHPAYGFDGVVAKPYLPDELLKVLQDVTASGGSGEANN